MTFKAFKCRLAIFSHFIFPVVIGGQAAIGAESPVPVNVQPTSKIEVPKSARAFRQLWEAAVVQTSVPQAQKELKAFKVALAADDTLPDSLRQLLSTLSVDGKFDLPAPLKDQSYPAFGVLHLLGWASAASAPNDEAKKPFDELKGRVSKHFQYGWAQSSYDGYLKELNNHSRMRLVATCITVVRPAELNAEDLLGMCTLFRNTGDTEWEIKVIRWQCGNLPVSDLISDRSPVLWKRLAELETGLARELDLYLYAASNVNYVNLQIVPRPAKAPPEIAAPTVVQCQEVVEAMLKMEMPWEAWLFLDHIKQKWGIDLPELRPKIKKNWDFEINISPKAGIHYLRHPVFVAAIKITPDMSLEQFIAQISERFSFVPLRER